MSKKRRFTLLLVIALAVIMTVSGTLAWYTESEETVNAMGTGNVTVMLFEQQRSVDRSKLEAYRDPLILAPIVGGLNSRDGWGMPTAGNYVDKIVTVKNTGVHDSYIRVMIAVPAALDDPDHRALVVDDGRYFDAANTGAYNDSPNPAYGDISWEQTAANADIDGMRYNIYAITYSNVFAYQQMSGCPAIVGFYLDPRVDYNGTSLTLNGKVLGYDPHQGIQIPVCAQAVQAAGFESAREAFDASGLPANPWDKEN